MLHDKRLVEEQPEHVAAILRIVSAAFGRDDEARLVDALRSDGDLALSLVARAAGSVRGHVALSRLRSPAGALALAPLAVLPSDQGKGIGSALVRRAIVRSRELGWRIIFVVGEPAFYQRFGFSADAAAGYPCLYAGPHLMALPLSGAGSGGREPVIYAAAFDLLD